MTAINSWADLSAIAQSVQEDAQFVVRETYRIANLVTQFSDLAGGNTRKNYTYNEMSAGTIAETDDLTSTAFAPGTAETLTPYEIGLMAAVSDLRRDSEAPESIVTDVARELGLAAAHKINEDLVGDFRSLTGGSIGSVNGTPTWGFVSAAIERARYANKSTSRPLACVLHGYHWAVLSKSANIAGATIAAVAPGFQDELTRTGYVGSFLGVPLYVSYHDINGSGSTAWATGAVFPRDALALDWRRPVRIEAERDATMRGTQFVMSAVYAHGIWRPALGTYIDLLAVAPSS